ncbi:hypothetical protein ACWGR3_28920 [Streptomyces albidoflavus]
MTLLQAVLWFVAVALLIGIVIKLWPFIKNAVAIVDALVQLPALLKQVAAMKDQLTSIHHETHRNNGSSIKDAVDRVEKTTERLEEGVIGLHGRVDDVDRQLTALAREDESLWEALDRTDPEANIED